MMNAHAFRATLVMLSITASTYAYAQSPQPSSGAAPAEGLTDIVVTARRTNESLQKTPIAITALSAAALDKANVQQIDKIAQIAPNLVIQPAPGFTGAAGVSIRGIGESDPSLAADSRVGFYLDGVYVARQAGALFDLVDVERVEVLRGPQGTLFGRNTTGGAIQLITRKPSDTFGVDAKASYGRYDDWTMRARIDTGLNETLPIAASFAYLHRERDGYFDSTATPDSRDPGSLNTDALTAAVKADLGNVRFDYAYDRNSQVGAPAFFQYSCFFGAPDCPAPDAARGQANTYAYFSRSASLGGSPLLFAGPGERINGGGAPATLIPGEYRARSVIQGHSFTGNWKISPAFNLKSITGYRKMSIVTPGGFSQAGLLGQVLDFNSPTLYSVQPVLTFDSVDATPQSSKQFSQELQLTGEAGDFNYIVGAYYFREKVSYNEPQPLTLVLGSDQLVGLGIPAEVGDALIAQGIDLIGINTTPTQAYTQTAKSKAAYAQVSWRPASLNRDLELTAGIRYTRDSKRMNLANLTDGVPNVGNTSGSQTNENTSFLASVSYQVDPGVNVYGKVSTGYKSGGFNPAANGICDGVVDPATGACSTGYRLNGFDPEKLTAYEIGAKMDLFNRKLRLNLAAFYTRYKDLQVSQFIASAGGATTNIVNAGKAEYKGIEAEATILPMRGLTLTGTVGYTDAKYKQFLFRDASGTLFDIKDRARFGGLAKFNANASVEYLFPPSSLGTVGVRASYAYRSRVFFTSNDLISPFNASTSSPPTNTVDARIALSDMPLGSRAKGEIALVGENLLNEDQVLFGIDFGSLGFSGQNYGMKRRASLQLRITY